jgi:hypothetical protein
MTGYCLARLFHQSQSATASTEIGEESMETFDRQSATLLNGAPVLALSRIEC